MEIKYNVLFKTTWRDSCKKLVYVSNLIKLQLKKVYIMTPFRDLYNTVYS